MGLRSEFTVGIVDTTFARVDMARFAIEEVRSLRPSARIMRLTVPGIKNTPYGAKKLIDAGCEGVLVLGWVGPTTVDKISYAVASMGLVMLQLQTGIPIVDVTVHEDEAQHHRELVSVAEDRTRKHTKNLILLLSGDLSEHAGMGLRQGRRDVGPL